MKNNKELLHQFISFLKKNEFYSIFRYELKESFWGVLEKNYFLIIPYQYWLFRLPTVTKHTSYGCVCELNFLWLQFCCDFDITNFIYMRDFVENAYTTRSSTQYCWYNKKVYEKYRIKYNEKLH